QGERQFARDNKSLGQFRLDGIAPAPRGIPQIEVTFDIDANGIVNVSAKDLGTGTVQKITITASSNLSEEEIEKAVKDAEKFADEDKAAKEKIEVKNNAEHLVFQTEKTLNDLGDKISADEKAGITAEIEKLKEVIKTDDTEKIKAATDELTKKFYEISQKLYQQAQPEGEQQTGPQDDGTVDAEYTVDEDNK
ncbi:MAG: Hsp70 family protein, partial [Clostridia bacterium]|nr:Hsp70 family protein [Clostridia bacterium]